MFRSRTHYHPEYAIQYAKGLFQAQKANIERMTERVIDSEYHQIQHFISESPWDWRAAFDSTATSISNSMEQFGGKVGLLIDESSFVKKGKNSVGVARQYLGSVGKVDNGQVAVFAGLSTDNYYGLIDAALYLPKSWTEDKDRCKKAGVPLAFQKYKTKPQLAVDIIKHQKKNGIHFDFIGADGLYGNSPELLKCIDELGLLFVFDVHSDQHVYLTMPEIGVPEAKSHLGRKPSIPKCSSPQPIKVGELVKTIADDNWEDVILRMGTKGAIRSKIYVIKVYTWEQGAPTANERLLIIRNSGGEIKYALSNAQEGKYTNKELAQMQAQRYFVERTFEDAKKELGMSQYQIRGWLAWHHHIALVLLALEFILIEKLQYKNEYPLLTAYDIKEVFIKVYATKGNLEEIMAQIRKRHKQRDMDIERNRGR